MPQERPDGAAGGGHLRSEPQHRQPLLRPFAQGNLEREHPRGAAGKTPVFELLKRGEKVYVTVVPDCSLESLMPVIKGLILEQSTIYTDGWRAYDGLVLNGYEHYRVFHSENESVLGKSHVNGIENVQTCGLRGDLQRGGLRSSTVQLGRVRATLEGVRTRNEVSSGGGTTTATTACWLLSRGCTGRRILIGNTLVLTSQEPVFSRLCQ